MGWRRRLARGFTLIEMAIVLVVIGLVFSGGLVAVAPVLQNSRETSTNGKMDRIEQALTLYVIRNGCLPCPADATIATGGANAGWAHGAAYYNSGCTAACDAAVTAQGIVPWVTLGLSEEEGRDGFGYRFDYAVTAALVATNGMVRTPPATYPAGTLVVNMSSSTNGGAAPGTNTTSAAAYVLISHGVDHNLAYTSGGVRSPDQNGGIDQSANSDGTPFVQDSPTGDTATSDYFDDIVRFRTAPIIIQLCGSNACGNPA